MNIKQKIKDVIKNPGIIWLKLGHLGFFNWINDKRYLEITHYLLMNEKLNLKSPKTYNQKLQWLKLYNRKNAYTSLVDKYEVRNFVKNKIGKEYLIPLLGVWDNFEEIDFNLLPNTFVLKCTHDSGGLVICDNKKKFNKKKARSKIMRSLNSNYYYGNREWVYKNVDKKIIAEKLMIDNSTKELRDYKFFCFDGEPKFLFVATDREKNPKFNFYDLEFNFINVKNYYDNAFKEIKKPRKFKLMIKIAKLLSANIPHVRVDLYEINGSVYFGEMTFFHFSGWKKFVPEKYDKIFGDLINLPEKYY